MIGAQSANRRRIHKFGGISARPGAGRGESLASLAQSGLRGAFYSWHGLSGRRYVLSVFDGSQWPMLSEFESVAIVGVASDGATRRPVCVLSSRELRALGPALSTAATEWHVLFSADDAAIKDLAGSLMN
jgi:hypothetical protein